ncbi:MAG: WYL domain-containing protein [Candidatus Methylacidiphilales bacterium]
MNRPSRPRLVKTSAKLLTRPPLRRFQHILEALQRDVRPTRRQLAEECAVTIKTIQRDMDFLRDQMRLPIAFDPDQGGYALTEPLDTSRQLELTPGELVSIFVTERALQAYRGSALEAPLRTAFEKLTLALDGQVSVPLSDLGMQLSVRQLQAAPIETKIFQTLATAVQKQQAVELDYVKLGDKKPKGRKLEPYHLTCYQGAWYAIGHDLRSDEIRTFHLSRIKRATLLPVFFTRPRSFRIETYLEKAFGIFRGKDDHQIILRFDPWAAQLIRERRVHPSQRLQELTDGGLELRLSLSSLEEIEPWVLSWGTHVRVLGPKELIERVRKTARTIAAT